ncbi:MAG TPA: NADH-quinone oxidoreductase subunit A [Candidatus Limnocylindrales bacterium]|nr:NADH-quinone oxidoreductase subunit A [Candidatus Limnocylindrales bacterium]
MQFDYINIPIFLGLGAFLCALMMGLGALLRPANPERAKTTTYECGEVVEGNSWINFNIRFYVVALVFVIFDVEVAFVYPVVAVFKQWVADGRGLVALTEIALFIAILVCGLVYVWRKGDLQWVKKVAAARAPQAPPPTAPGGRVYVTD